MAYCPYCDTDLEEFSNQFDGIYEWHECPVCFNPIWLHYEEVYLEDTNEEWGIWTFLKNEKY